SSQIASAPSRMLRAARAGWRAGETATVEAELETHLARRTLNNHHERRIAQGALRARLLRRRAGFLRAPVARMRDPDAFFRVPAAAARTPAAAGPPLPCGAHLQ